MQVYNRKKSLSFQLAPRGRIGTSIWGKEARRENLCLLSFEFLTFLPLPFYRVHCMLLKLFLLASSRLSYPDTMNAMSTIVSRGQIQTLTEVSSIINRGISIFCLYVTILNLRKTYLVSNLSDSSPVLASPWYF